MSSAPYDRFNPAAEAGAQAPGDSGRTSAPIRGEAAAGPLSMWVVIDEEGHPCYCHVQHYACEEHIFDAIREEIEEASSWVIREYVRREQ